MNRRALALAGLLAVAGVTHFAFPRFYDAIMPRVIPEAWHRPLTYASGAAELVCAALLARPRTRRLGGWLTALLLVAVLPANVQMALDSLDAARRELSVAYHPAVAWGRLPVQVPLIAWAVAVARDHRKPEEDAR